MTKYKVSVKESVIIPATDTSTPEQTHTFADFMDQFILHGEVMRTEANMQSLVKLWDTWSSRGDGEYVSLEEDVFVAAKASAKYEIDKLMGNRLPMHVAIPILKLYHQFAKSERTE